MAKTQFLYLDQPTMVKAGVADSAHCVEVLDEMFKLVSAGDYIMGGQSGNEHGVRINFPDHPQFPGMPANGPDRRFMAMVAYLGGRFHAAGVKWYGSNVANPARGLPRCIHMIILNDPDTCEPIAIMDGTIISSMRTGCVPGVGVKYLANPDAKTVSCIGTGPIGRSCLSGIMVEAKKVDTVSIFDINPDNAAKFAEMAEKEFKVKTVICETAEECVRAGDIISVAASRLRPVIVKDEWLKAGSTLILTGNCRMDASYVLSSKIVFDNPKMHKQYMEDAHRSPKGVQAAYDYLMGGDIYRLIDAGKLPPMEQQIGLGDIALGKAVGRTSPEDRVVFQTGGMPVEDVAWAYETYVQAKAKGLGQWLTLWDEPYAK